MLSRPGPVKLHQLVNSFESRLFAQRGELGRQVCEQEGHWVDLLTVIPPCVLS